ncbi:MAG: HAMP domain-containing histidine kinase [Clostridia bacterium]|nr:HAMP domain-containing histidine kinase [Clostridia bacterium]
MKRDMHSAKRKMRWILIFGTAIVLIAGAILAVGIESFLETTGILSIEDISNLGIWGFVIINVVSIIIGSVLAYFASKIILKPINELVDGLGKLSQGDYSTRLHFNEKSDMSKISDAFNSCAEELEHTEIMRSDFINNFSHEFKTPISAINGFVKLLERDDIPKEKRQKYLAVIREETERLSDMTTNILMLTKVESQGILTEKEEFYLSEQIRSCGLLLEKKWQEKRLKLIFDFEEHTIVANEEMLKQVWLNLLDNAIKFAKKDSQLTVRIQSTGEVIIVDVENEGVEIKEEDRERIFHKFYQAEKTSSKSGNGIGLSIVKYIVELHNGTVDVESGKGKTVFTVALPQK